jgi:hypothetical protein
MTHATDTLYPPYIVPAEIDRRMRPLIEACWQAGLRTVTCCEGEPSASHGPRAGIDLACITFCSDLEAMIFLTLAGPTRWTTRARNHRNEARWGVEGRTVTFPHEDIRLAAYTLQASGWTVDDLITMYSASRQPFGREFTPSTAPHREDPGGTVHRLRRCRQCTGAIPPGRRHDAVYCSRRCQLRARKRARGAQDGRGRRKAPE